MLGHQHYPSGSDVSDPETSGQALPNPLPLPRPQASESGGPGALASQASGSPLLLAAPPRAGGWDSAVRAGGNGRQGVAEPPEPSVQQLPGRVGLAPGRGDPRRHPEWTGGSAGSPGASGFRLSRSHLNGPRGLISGGGGGGEVGVGGGAPACPLALSPAQWPWGGCSASVSALGREGAALLRVTLPSSPSSARRQFPPSPSAPKIPSWQIPVKSPSPSSPAAVNHHSSSDISPVSNESTSSSPVKEGHSPEGSTATYHLLGPQEEGEGVVDVKGQVRMEVQGEEEKRGDEDDEEDEDVSRVDEEDRLGVQREDRRGGDGQINEQVEKLRRPEGASNESERD